jgi:hypothetical protein
MGRMFCSEPCIEAWKKEFIEDKAKKIKNLEEKIQLLKAEVNEVNTTITQKL